MSGQDERFILVPGASEEGTTAVITDIEPPIAFQGTGIQTEWHNKQTPYGPADIRLVAAIPNPDLPPAAMRFFWAAYAVVQAGSRENPVTIEWHGDGHGNGNWCCGSVWYELERDALGAALNVARARQGKRVPAQAGSVPAQAGG